MKHYVKPEIKISMFDIETVVTGDTVGPLSQPAYGQNLNSFINNNESKAVQRNLDFNKAIKFN